MTSAQELYQSGQLTDAIAACNDEIRNAPDDTAKRAFLCELLCFAGDFERADKQLDTIVYQDPKAMISAGTWRHLIRAATARDDFYKNGHIPDFIGEPTAGQQLRLEASIELRESNFAKAQELLNKAEEIRKPVSGKCDDNVFDDMRDLDDFLGAVLEVLGSNGKYYWVDYSQIKTLEFTAPERPLDLLWRQAKLLLQDGTESEICVPSIYPVGGTEKAGLGRETEWEESSSEIIRGIGQRTLLIGEQALPILQINKLEFSGAQ